MRVLRFPACIILFALGAADQGAVTGPRVLLCMKNAGWLHQNATSTGRQRNGQLAARFQFIS